MAIIKLTTLIQAPPEICFNLSRSVDIHLTSMQQYQEQAIAGTTTGLMNLHDTVTWQARHFGWPFIMQVALTEVQLPVFFADQMRKGPFKMMRHYHYFKPHGNGTRMTDEFVFRSPLGWLGRVADALILKPYLTRLLLRRNQTIKQLAEDQPHEHLNTKPNLCNPAA
ncbi:SRPBCC family protein [Mucilaginibacter sp.]